MIKNFKSLTHTIKLFVFGALVSLSFSVSANPTEFVNPFLGTDYHGHTFPGAALPGGMVQLSPDTDVQGWDREGQPKADLTISALIRVIPELLADTNQYHPPKALSR